MSRSWKFRVVKRMRGMQGQEFDFPTAATFATEAEARAYAERFARAQAASGVRSRIDVRTRAGGWRGHRGDTVATYISAIVDGAWGTVRS